MIPPNMLWSQMVGSFFLCSSDGSLLLENEWVHGWHDSGYPESGGEKQPGWFWKKLNTVKAFGSLEHFHNMVNLPDAWSSNQRFTTGCLSFHPKLKRLKPCHPASHR
jgi:hypothetical protein